MLTLQSPCKVNLFLQILSRRADGYHELASLFQAVDLMDTIHFTLSTCDHLSCSDPTLPVDDRNLISKALHLFRKKTGLSFGVDIHLQKRIPQQAGLGGGSGNAATTFWALNQLLGYPASCNDLICWSAEVGSDVPFFLSHGTAYCTGRGERIQSMTSLSRESLWIVKPKQGTATPEVYKKLDMTKLLVRDPRKALHSFYEGAPLYFNDLEQPAMEVLPELARIKKQLMQAGFSTVLLSGSGSSFFCLGEASLPHLPDCALFQAHWINRSEKEWYS